ncbi:hypothetical protein QFC24_001156 [Naganishia onofrii]|uniref:Uncharacterized protein n=1 Tax=Naganishia onofrii TaxID=1851511 RepID=A0ACC2XSB5_9TREE|nr:hypothetical protein QFC24_001156 [Naganishia onofrii]
MVSQSTVKTNSIHHTTLPPDTLGADRTGLTDARSRELRRTSSTGTSAIDRLDESAQILATTLPVTLQSGKTTVPLTGASGATGLSGHGEGGTRDTTNSMPAVDTAGVTTSHSGASARSWWKSRRRLQRPPPAKRRPRNRLHKNPPIDEVPRHPKQHRQGRPRHHIFRGLRDDVRTVGLSVRRIAEGIVCLLLLVYDVPKNTTRRLMVYIRDRMRYERDLLEQCIQFYRNGANITPEAEAKIVSRVLQSLEEDFARKCALSSRSGNTSDSSSDT